ncbi:MAG: beta-lactamase family protein [Candidatus Sericytochromatia bacterium]|nr:beta-lactamase family protein [Candidatus Tanganyikabacteria bacterium]
MRQTLLPLALVAALAACAPALRAVQIGDREGAWRELEAYVQAQMRDSGVVGAAVAVVEGDTVRSAGFGYFDREAGRKATSQTAFRVGSVTKPITATVVLQLAEAGKIDLDAPYRTYVPEFAIRTHDGKPHPVTVRQLLDHHAGIPTNRVKGALAANPPHFSSVVGDLAEVYATAPPDTIYGYSNLGYDLLGVLIERQTGRSFEEVVRDRVLDPVGMAGSDFDPQRLGRSYERGQSLPDWPMRDVPAGGLIAHVDDLARFGKVALRRGALPGDPPGRRLLSERWWNEMWRPQNEHVSLDLDFRIGLGWMLMGTEPIADSGFLARHSGNVGRYRAELEVLPDRDLAVAVVTNTAEGGQFVYDAARRALELMIAAQGPRPGVGASPVAPRPLPPAPSLAALEGPWATPVGTFVTRAIGDNLAFDFWGATWETYRKPDATLGLQGKLLGFLPFPAPVAVRTMEPLVARVDGQDRLAIRRNGFYWMGDRIVPTPVRPAWQRMVGDYVVTNLGDDFPIMESFALRMDGGLLYEDARYVFGGLREYKALRILSNTEAVVTGLGNLTGDTLVRSGDGRLRFSGLDLVRR